MQLEINSIVVQEDNLAETSSDEAELRFWKRVKVKGHAYIEDEAHAFKVILGMRDRLMLVKSQGDPRPEADRIAKGLIYKMCEFITEPTSSLFVRRYRDRSDLSEWMVRDAEHASGLIHRIKEEGKFEAGTEAPTSPLLGDIIEGLVDAVAYTTKSMEEWDRQFSSGGVPDRLRFETYAWNVHCDQLVELSDNHEMMERFARFFDWAEVYQECVRTLQRNTSLEEIKEPPLTGFSDSKASGANRKLTSIHSQATGLGKELIEDYGTPTQKDRGTDVRL